MIVVTKEGTAKMAKYVAQCPYCRSEMECDASDLLFLSEGCILILKCPVCEKIIPSSFITEKTGD